MKALALVNEATDADGDAVMPPDGDGGGGATASKTSTAGRRRRQTLSYPPLKPAMMMAVTAGVAMGVEVAADRAAVAHAAAPTTALVMAAVLATSPTACATLLCKKGRGVVCRANCAGYEAREAAMARVEKVFAVHYKCSVRRVKSNARDAQKYWDRSHRAAQAVAQRGGRGNRLPCAPPRPPPPD